jgi:hypothetical protein
MWLRPVGREVGGEGDVVSRLVGWFADLALYGRGVVLRDIPDGRRLGVDFSLRQAVHEKSPLNETVVMWVLNSGVRQ